MGKGATKIPNLTSQLDNLCLCASDHFNIFTNCLIILSWVDKVQGLAIYLALGVSFSLSPEVVMGRKYAAKHTLAPVFARALKLTLPCPWFWIISLFTLFGPCQKMWRRHSDSSWRAVFLFYGSLQVTLKNTAGWLGWWDPQPSVFTVFRSRIDKGPGA